ncbi:unnamed protein product [Caenorhabditis nigoni]
MKASSNPIKKNHLCIKTCILYEVLQKKPIFDSYRNFCNTVGKDVMEYLDFEFWYYRFYHGQMDFYYDRSADPKPKKLVDIPVVSMIKIAEYLDPVERTRLRTMNHAIKDVADSFPPVFEEINVSLKDRYLRWSWNDKHFWCFKKGRGYSLHKPNNTRVANREKSYIKKSLELLAPVLKMPNIQVNHFSLHLHEEELDPDDLLPDPFSPRSVFIYSHNANKVVQFLTAMNPGYLESICLEIRYLRALQNDDRIVLETDQFKQAKSVEFKSDWTTFDVESLVNFSHLKSFKCYMSMENTIQDVPRIRDTISTFEEFESCELKFCKRRYSMRTFAVALGEVLPIGPLVEQATIKHRYQIPESNECLEYEMKENRDFCFMNIVKVR